MKTQMILLALGLGLSQAQADICTDSAQTVFDSLKITTSTSSLHAVLRASELVLINDGFTISSDKVTITCKSSDSIRKQVVLVVPYTKDGHYYTTIQIQADEIFPAVYPGHTPRGTRVIRSLNLNWGY